MAVRATKGERGSILSFEPLTGDSDWMFFEPVPTTGWAVVTVFPRSAFELDAGTQRHLLFLIVFTGLVTLALAGSTVVRMTRLDAASRLWTDAAILALMLSAGVGVLWWVADRHPASTGESGRPLVDRDGVEQYLHANGTRDRTGVLRPVVRIPTGVYVRSIAFQSSTDVTVTGFIWQRYADGVHDGIARGFAMPEADTITDKQVTEWYRTKAGGEERIGWQFIVKLREHFSYARYPFDRQEVWLRLRPADLRSDLVLVPDFDGYPIMAPGALPGVSRDLVLPGWEATSAFFDYRLHSYNTDFGLRKLRAYDDAPELYFNVSLRRLFLGPFVSSIVPLSVAVAMIFGVLVISTRRDKSSSLFGFSAESSLRSAAALFFVVSFQHVALRNSLASPVLMYFEYFYFAVYLAILLVSVNAILFAAQLGIRPIEHRENLIPKVLFWPLWTAAVFVITYVALY
jgi:hypothetical protein